MHSVLHPVSLQTHAVTTLWWWMFGVATLVYVIVLAALLGAASRGQPPNRDGDLPSDARPSGARWVAATAFGTACIVGAFLAYSLHVASVIGAQPPTPLRVTVTGHQWWWEATYGGSAVDRFTTANEIHIPVGQPIEISLRSADVIHSFWVPNIGGKRDLIPGHPMRLVVQADTPGVYRGQCSQFCGLQHAHMALFVVAESADRFAQWAANQRQPAISPADSARLHGRDVFLTARCGSCHTVSGVLSLGTFGPNLSHLASREMIAGGTLTNTADHLATWILDPQSIKPGATMPQNPLDRNDIAALVAYLESLK
jgi:cytochrome c oxidase subunit II